MAGRFEQRDREKSQSLVKGRPIFIKSSSNYFENKTISESDFSFDFRQSVLWRRGKWLKGELSNDLKWLLLNLKWYHEVAHSVICWLVAFGSFPLSQGLHLFNFGMNVSRCLQVRQFQPKEIYAKIQKYSKNPEIFSNPDISVRLWLALLAGCQTQQVVACKEKIIFCNVLQEEWV